MKRAASQSASPVRPLRAGQLVRRALAETLTRWPLRAELPAAARLTIYQVKMSADLRYAKVLLLRPAPVSAGEEKDILRALNGARGFFRRALASQLDTKFIPDLRFAFDRQAEEIQNLEARFASLAAKPPAAKAP